jgi:SAM-dependent methyltransferase
MLLNLEESTKKSIYNFLGYSKTHESTEFEVRFGTFSKQHFVSDNNVTFYYNLIQNLEKLQCKKHEQIITDYINTNRVTFVNNEWIETTKTKLDVCDSHSFDIRLALNKEECKKVKAPSTDETNHVRKKSRKTYQFNNFQVDCSVVNTVYNDKKSTTYEIEIEFFKTAEINDVVDMIYYILKIKQENFMIVSNQESSIIRKEYMSLLNNDTSRFKMVGAQAQTLHRNQLSNLYNNDYAVTDKIDGLRCLLYITRDGKLYGLTSNGNIIKTDMYSESCISCVLDTECIKTNSKMSFHIFDILVYNGQDVRGNQEYDLPKRLHLIDFIIESVKNTGIYDIVKKRYYFKNVFLGAKILYNSISEYTKDGLIFVPMDSCYPTTSKWPELLKWKPEHLNSIDLYSVKQKGTNTWLLYTHSKPERREKLDKQTVDVLFDIDKITGTSTCLETFKTEIPESLLDPVTNMPYVSETVIEFTWDKNSASFLPIKTRWDKTQLNKGNFITVALDIWDSIHNPVTLSHLFNLTKHSSAQYYKNMRYYHNRVKENLYKKYIKPKTKLLELCSGKGGDISKWKRCNVELVDGYDIDTSSVNECIKRNVSSTNPNKNYNFYQLDLYNPESKTVIKGNRKDLYDNVCCHFAIHYFMKSSNTLSNFIDILDTNLADNGYFVTTFMDNKQLDIVMANTDSILAECNNEILYYFDKKNVNDGLYGNELTVYLNGNNILGKGSNEYVINTELFIQYMNSRGYQLVESKLFNEYMHHQSDTIDINMEDYEYNISAINRLAVFQKKVTDKLHVKQLSGGNLEPIESNTIVLQDSTRLLKVHTVHDIIDYHNTMSSDFINKNDIDNSEINESLETNLISYGIPIKFVDAPVTVPNTIAIYKYEYKSDENEIVHDNWYIVLFTQTNKKYDSQKLQKMSIKDLKSLLKNLSLKVTGNKSELIERIEKNEN